MKILHIAWWMRPYRGGGLIAYAEELMDELLKREHQVYYFCAGHYDFRIFPRLKKWQRNGINIFEIVNPPNYVGASNQDPLNDISEPVTESFLKKTLEEVKPDIVHIHELSRLTANCVQIIKSQNISCLFMVSDFWNLCPTIYLFQQRASKSCTDYRDGFGCVECISGLPKKEQLKMQERFRWAGRPLRENFYPLYSLARKVFKEKKIDSYTKPIKIGNISQDQLEIQRILANKFVKRRKFFINALNLADRVFSKSERLREIYMQYGVRPDRIVAMETSARRFSRIQRRKYDTKFPFIFGYIGRVDHAKGLQIAVEAFNGIPSDKAKFIIYGNGDSDLMRFLKEKNSCVQFQPPFTVDQLQGILNSIDVGVLPSLCEDTAPNVVREFQLAGIPVLASRIGGIPELIFDGQTDLLFEPGNIQELREKVQNLIENPEVLNSFYKNLCRYRIKTMDEHVNEIEALYQELIG